MDLDIWFEEVERDAHLAVSERRQQLSHGECVRLHLKFVVFGGGVNCFSLPRALQNQMRIERFSECGAQASPPVEQARESQ